MMFSRSRGISAFNLHRENIVQRYPTNAFHSQIAGTTVFPGIVHRHNVRVIDLRQNLSFIAEPQHTELI